MMSHRQRWSRVLQIEKAHGDDALIVIEGAICDMLDEGEEDAAKHLFGVADMLELLKRTRLIS